MDDSRERPLRDTRGRVWTTGPPVINLSDACEWTIHIHRGNVLRTITSDGKGQVVSLQSI